MHMPSLPLDGITVVSIEQAVAAPFATRQLADLGARVIKIERDSGDFARTYDETVHGDSSFFVWLNRTKESVVIDLKSEEGRQVMRSLIAQADVFVSNLKPGAVERLGLGAEDCQETNPGLIHASISGYGPGGSYTERKAYDLIIQCEAGMLSVTGTEETPSKVGPSIADIAAGMYAYSGILTALLQRGRTGEGATLDISMLEALGEWMGFPYYYTRYGGTPPPRSGARHAAIGPYGPFRCGDGEQVFLGIQNEREWAHFCDRVLNRPELATDPRFERNSLRVAHGEELTTEIERAFADRTAEQAAQRLEEVGIANALLRDMHGFADHPQLAARERWTQVGTPAGPVDALLPPATPLGATPVMGPVPALGEHTEAVLAELGLSPTGGSPA